MATQVLNSEYYLKFNLIIKNGAPIRLKLLSNNVNNMNILISDTAPQFWKVDKNYKFSLSYSGLSSSPISWTEGCELNISNIKIKSAYNPTKINIYAIKGWIINETIDLTDKIYQEW